MPLTQEQRIYFATGQDLPAARQDLLSQLEARPEVRIVTLSAYTSQVGSGQGLEVNLVAVVEDIWVP